MSDGQRMQRRRRLPVPLTVAAVIVIGVIFAGSFLIRQFVEGASVSAAADETAALVDDLPGVAFAAAEAETDVKSRREVRRELFSEQHRPDGDVRLTVTLSSDATPRDVASAMIRSRELFDSDRFAEYNVALEYVVPAFNQRIFDGWRARWEPAHDDEVLADAATLAFSLPNGTWIDLDPSSYEQGRFGVGPGVFWYVLREASVRFPGGPDGAITVMTELDATTAGEFLSGVIELEADVSSVTDVPVAYQVRSTGAPDASTSDIVFATDLPSRVDAAWRRLAKTFGEAAPSSESSSIVIETFHDPEYTVSGEVWSVHPFDLTVAVRHEADCVTPDPAFAGAVDAALAHLRASGVDFDFSAWACGREVVAESRAAG